MRILAGILLLSIAACGAGEAESTASTAEFTTSSTTSATTASTADGVTTTAPTPRSTGGARQDGGAVAYDVFLAAVAETVADTRFAEVPFDEPELTVATGLALCEAIESEGDTDPVIAGFVAELVDGDPSSADEDQLVLSGALLGAAETALCPDA